MCNRDISLLTFSSFPALNIVLTIQYASFSALFILPICNVVRFSLTDDLKCLTPFPAERDPTCLPQMGLLTPLSVSFISNV